ncbi:MAG TPA: hypothetical protein VLC93_14665, partial [Myxococcota bacterium]|nr:hypothetical protein [Myxococcota bacterium]
MTTDSTAIALVRDAVTVVFDDFTAIVSGRARLSMIGITTRLLLAHGGSPYAPTCAWATTSATKSAP